MRKKYFFTIILFLLLSFVGRSVKAQTESELALIKRKIYVTPEIWEINKNVTMSYM